MTAALERDRVSRLPEGLMLGVSLLIVIASALLSYRSSEYARAAIRQRHVTEEIVKVNAALSSSLKDAETGQRGFLLTGQERYLEPYNGALAAIPGLLERLRNATAIWPDQRERLSKLEPFVSAKLDELRSTIGLRRDGKLNEAMAIVDSGRGKGYMDDIRAIEADIEQTSSKRLERFEADADEAASNLRGVSIGGSVLLGAFLLLSTITIFHGMARRDKLYRQAYMGEKLLATTLAGIADAVIATDLQGRINFINPVALRLTGWTQAEAHGTVIDQVFVIVNETTRVKVDNPLHKALTEGVTVGLANHTNLIAKDGTDIPIDDSAAPLKDENGQVIGAVIVFRDISARRRADRQLRNANQELQQFVDAAAHDLRSPLNSVGAMAQLLAVQFEEQLGPQGGELIGYITGGIDRMRRLLDDLLAFARIGNFDEATAHPISLDAPLRLALENLKADIERTDAVVSSGPLPVVVMLEAHAVQVFQNLIGNALKYHGQDPPRIQVRAVQKDSAWLISVADNGIGIKSDYLEQIFKPFKRLHGDDYPGSGIGLSTCQKIVLGYGGRIWVESEPGRGSTFFFTVPGAS